MKLIDQNCSPFSPALSEEAIAALLPQVPGWSLKAGKLVRNFSFRNFHETIEFVNALAWVIHRQDHHPELAVGYKECVASFTTHSAGDVVTQNDFVSAAKANAVYAQRAAA